MIHLGLLLLVGGITAAVLREQKNKTNIQKNSNYLPAPDEEIEKTPQAVKQGKITAAKRKQMMKAFKASLDGYTYFEKEEH